MISLNVLWKRLKNNNLKRFLQSKVILFCQQIWEPSRVPYFSLTQKIFFIFLYIAEQGYKVVFFIHQNLNKKQQQFKFSVLSVGNISAGGTGKSVFVQFLINELNIKQCAIVLRGYRGKCQATKSSFLVGDGDHIFCDVSFSGDEAFMLAKNLRVPVVVGRSKIESCNLLDQYAKNRSLDLKYVVLDDGYQNNSIKKDLEIVLLDARRPFENGHCLPAGRLREKDLSRADVIILTHSKSIPLSNLEIIKNEIFMKHPKIPVFAGYHAFSSVMDVSFNKLTRDSFFNKQFVVFAGIGSFSGFLDTLSQIGIQFGSLIEYPDHHIYSLDDIKHILSVFKKTGAKGIVTTQKDWTKIINFLDKFPKERHFFYCLDIEFKFISSSEKSEFKTFLNLKI